MDLRETLGGRRFPRLGNSCRCKGTLVGISGWNPSRKSFQPSCHGPRYYAVKRSDERVDLLSATAKNATPAQEADGGKWKRIGWGVVLQDVSIVKGCQVCASPRGPCSRSRPSRQPFQTETRDEIVDPGLLDGGTPNGSCRPTVSEPKAVVERRGSYCR